MQILLAVLLALASAVSYAVAAVVQQREASRHHAGGLALVGRLVRTRAWWAAQAATLCGAALHLAALGLGALVLVQPLGIAALVFALVLGARRGVPVGRSGRAGAALVVVGLPSALVAVGASGQEGVPLLGYWTLAPLIAVAAAALALAAARRRSGAALHAVAAALCFGLTSGTAKLAWLGQAGPAAIGVGLVAAVAGMVLAQHAYRDGGLGAPLATLTLVDPLTAGAIGVLVLGEPLTTSLPRLGIGAAGVAMVVAGVFRLAPHRAPTAPGRTALLAPGGTAPPGRVPDAVGR
ncbi:DMT family transporter [Pseudonocardia ailaonensis]|uniref:DMT family transporter n=1 Tax=Pseudonocardia ailaonensis TaxID=367279 RepID=UPI0031D4D3A6